MEKIRRGLLDLQGKEKDTQEGVLRENPHSLGKYLEKSVAENLKMFYEKEL